MAKYKAYPEYKETRLGWLAEIPAHWDAKKLKYLGQAIIGLTYSPDDVVNEAEGTLVLRSSNVQNGNLDFSDNVYVTKKIPFQLKVKENDILICARNGSRALIGKNARITKEAEGMSFGAFMSIFRSHYNNYLSKVFNSALFEYQSGSFLTATINQLTTSNLNSFEIPLPPKEERDHIVHFLEHETAKIDNLIEKQQQLIEMIKEKRQAVISHAVTKGLNPDVPMKDSGVEWLGEVPDHWDKIKLKHITRKIIDAEHKTAPYFDDGEYLVCRTTNVKNGKLYLEGGLYTDQNTYNEWIKRGKPESGDILFTREAPAGEACVYSGDIPLCLGQRMVLFKLEKNRVVPEFVLHSIYSGLSDDFVKQLSQGSTVSHFNMSDIQNLPLYEPPLCEQKEIKEYLECNLSKHDNLIVSAQDMISLMQERRTALISAAVTGKIDVRGWVAPDTQDIEESQEVNA
ncbi:restriction endonuclease subunit S [Pectobacterium carotovorum]|uniref:restriction endonuclease subunit S n=1 Tax=Pectobacterium carotovorum TaxID=554 RepID=UPI0029DC16EE|nr:restriction endonuclease subunit S [Pectobacterium carotovorum]MDX6915991.1 restriction endonuclease subunit S [Pectobacterium carotovorum]